MSKSYYTHSLISEFNYQFISSSYKVSCIQWPSNISQKNYWWKRKHIVFVNSKEEWKQSDEIEFDKRQSNPCKFGPRCQFKDNY